MALVVFLSTLFFIYFRPFKIPIWIWSTIGGLCAYVSGVVNFNDIIFVWKMIYDSSFTLVGLIIFAISLEQIGFFSAIANLIIKMSKNSQTLQIHTLRFYIFIMLFGFILSALFSNDGAILILTPLIIAFFSSIKLNTSTKLPIIFLLFMSFVSDFGSNIFIFSNLTNIITSHSFNISFFEFVTFMMFSQVFVIISSILIFFMLFKKQLPKYLDFSTIDSGLPSKFTMKLCFLLILMLLFGIIFGQNLNIPISVFAILVGLMSAIIACFLKKTNIKNIIKNSPFDVVIFSLGLFIVVYGLNNIGLVSFLQNQLKILLLESTFAQIMIVGFTSSIFSSIINNLPMVMLGDLVLQGNEIYLAFANLLGCNIGSKLTPIGSLATLLWLSNLKRYDIKISFLKYMLLSFLVTMPVLFFALFGLYLSVILFT